jgi:SAM-dependent methyltransferase
MNNDAKALTQKQFGAHAEGYVTSPTHRAGYSLERLIELLAPQPGQRALDLATGGGHTALALARAGTWTVAGDLTQPMLHAARAHLREQGAGDVPLVRLDAEQLPFASASFDVITCRIAPHHFPDVAQFVRECARVVRPGGVVGIVDQLSPADPRAAQYINAFERLRDPSHLWAYNRAEWEGFFVGAGLTILHYEEFAREQALVSWAALMGCDADTVTRLRAMLLQAPAPVAAWLEPRDVHTPDARFHIRQFLLVGRREG